MVEAVGIASVLNMVTVQEAFKRRDRLMSNAQIFPAGPKMVLHMKPPCRIPATRPATFQASHAYTAASLQVDFQLSRQISACCSPHPSFERLQKNHHYSGSLALPSSSSTIS